MQCVNNSMLTLLKLLEIKGCIVTIDAMGCQKQIAKDILSRKANYLLMVKGNQQGQHAPIFSKQLLLRESICSVFSSFEADFSSIIT